MKLIDFSKLAGTHDLRLSRWGPYTKRYMGISHIPEIQAGFRFDLSVFPGLYRRNVNIPNVTWESGYYPWEAASDLSYFVHRHELIWKDQVYCDIAFCRLDEKATLIRCACVNQTEERQQLVLHYMASFHFPPIRPSSPEILRPCRVKLPQDGIWIDGLNYKEIRYAKFDPRENLTEDGQIRGEIREHGFVDGQGLGQGFGETKGDTVTYQITLAHNMSDAALLLRFRMKPEKRTRLVLTGMIYQEIELFGSGTCSLYQIPVGSLQGGNLRLTITSAGGAEVQIDGLVLVPVGTAHELQFMPINWNPEPERIEGPRSNSLILKYGPVENAYGLGWGASSFEIREFICDDLDSWMRYKIHNHVNEILRGPGNGHFTNVFMRPIFLAPASEHVFYGIVCTADIDSLRKRLATFDPTSPVWEKRYEKARSHAAILLSNPSGKSYQFSQERMAATVLTNVVYPVRTRGTWIRHTTPGRYWDSLYTWDSGFIGLGLLELDVDRAIDNLNAYVTELGERDAAFIHHGSPVPVQHYLFLELWNRTQSRELIEYFYPRLSQYHRFLAGRLGSSTTRSLKSNLLRTWDYFYNSGGWDDYPPQVYVHQHHLEATVTPVVNTAQTIRTAKILRMAALSLGKDVCEYDEDITILSKALQTYAWDQESGYFGYVCHDSKGDPTGIMRHESGINFNMGLDGAYPLVAGICTPEQEMRLIEHLMSEEHLWSQCGLSTVDQSAPYYKDDGYWNGAVWMPHQWFFWKTLLDMGKADEAHCIAKTALDVWKCEVESSYNCFEHFIIQTGRGAGWHHFGGLSTPVLKWYKAYHCPGHLSTGLNIWIDSVSFVRNNRSLSAKLKVFGQPHHTPVIIATMNAGNTYTVSWNGEQVEFSERYSGCLEILLPPGIKEGCLEVCSK